MLVIHFQQFANVKVYVENANKMFHNNNPNLLLISFITKMKNFLRDTKAVNKHFLRFSYSINITTTNFITFVITRVFLQFQL